MSLKKYEAFVRTVELGSLTKAAQSLGSTQSRISHILNDLEEEYGFRLMHRSRGGIELTEAGRLLLPRMQAIVQKEQELAECVAEIRNADAGTVRLGVFTSVAVHWLPGMIRAFQAAHPRAQLEMRSGDYHDVEQWLMEGSIDIGFVNVPSTVDCECIPLMEDRLLAILPRHSRFESYPRFPLVECETEPFISLLESSDHDARRALEAAGVKPNVRFYTKDDYAIIAMVEQGLGISIMPELLLKGRHDDIQMLPLVPEARRTIGIAIAAGDKAGPATRRFADYVVRYVTENR